MDRVGVFFRPTAYDASSAVHLVTSIDIKAPGVFDATAGKEKAEVRLGFTSENTPNATKPQDTLTKTHPSLGIKFKIERDPGSVTKSRFIDAEMFGWTGSTEIKSTKLEITNLPHTSGQDRWFRVHLYAVRTGMSSASLAFAIDDRGTDGSTFVSRIMDSQPWTLSNANFFTDNSVFSAASLSDEKTSFAGLSILADNHYAEVNTTAPNAPATQQVSALTDNGFTVNWTNAITGNFATGSIVEIVEGDDPFLPGFFHGASGSPGQSGGIVVNDAFAEDLRVSGFASGTTYRVRVRAYTDTPALSESLALNSVFAVTLFPPGIEYSAWRSLTFGSNAGNDLIAGPAAINNGAGISNLLAYAFGMDPLAPNLAFLPQMDANGQYLRLTYRKRNNITGTTYIPEISSNLSAWNETEIVTVSTSAPDSSGFVTVVVEDQFSIVANPRRFMRVKLFAAP